MAADFYAILGVEKTASDDEIKRAYRKLAHRYHPDKGEGDEAKFKEVNEAYQILSDPQKRQQYDQFGQAFQGGGPGAGPGGFDFSGFDFSAADNPFGDIFETFFGGGRTATRPKGRDLEVQVVVEFEEAAFGATKDLTLNVYSVCDRCEGSGAEPGTKVNRCDRCGGSGQEERMQRTVLGQIRTMAVCSKCDGRGEIPEKRCSKCKGEGRIRQARNVKVEIPAGIDNGQQIRLRGQGEAGPAGTPAGDLYVQVAVRPHPQLKREGTHLIAEARVGFSTAALGGTAEVTTLGGKKKIKIPSGTQSGKVIKLSGEGIASLQSGRRGDLLVEVKVETPQKLSRKAKKLLEELGDEL